MSKSEQHFLKKFFKSEGQNDAFVDIDSSNQNHSFAQKENLLSCGNQNNNNSSEGKYYNINK